LVLTDSEFSKTDLINRLNLRSDRLEILYPWVGGEFLRPSSLHEVEKLRERLNLPPHFWLYLGGYDYRKNIEFLLQAYAQAASARTIPPLVLAGTIPTLRSRVSCDVMGTLKRLQLKETQVRTPGRIEGGDLPVLFKAASLLIYPSLMEGFGLPPAEAMAAGTPVLVSNSSSLPEVVQQKNSLFDPNDVDNLIHKLLLASEDESQFLTKLSPAFTESYGIERYIQLIGRV
jgi:glycosyltransferase involved in cell wall biosynthesis